jgi:hypothetical protein
VEPLEARVLVVGARRRFREALRGVVLSGGLGRVVGEARSLEEASELIGSRLVDVAAVDARLMAQSWELAAVLGRRHPDVTLLTISLGDAEGPLAAEAETEGLASEAPLRWDE